MKRTAFVSRQLPDHFYDRLYICKNRKCRTIAPGKQFGCPKCRSAKLERVISLAKRQARRQEARSVFAGLLFSACAVYAASLVNLLAAAGLAAIHAVLLAVQIYGIKRSFALQVVQRFRRLLERDDLIDAFRSHIASIKAIEDSGIRYEQLREVSYIYDPQWLKSARLDCFEGIHKSRFLDYECDELVLEAYRKPLVAYFFDVARINPDKIGIKTVLYTINHFDAVVAEFSNGRAICARILYAGTKYKQLRSMLYPFLVTRRLVEELQAKEKNVVLYYFAVAKEN